LTKVVNGERASYSAPKFARMQERTRSQMLEDIVANLANHAETGQIPKPYRRGSWRPIGHMRPSSPLLDSVRDQFEGNKTFWKGLASSFMLVLWFYFHPLRLRSAGQRFHARVLKSRAVVLAERSSL
jgi:RAP1 GTPase activating protein 1